MFHNCVSLQKLNLSKFNTSKTKAMYEMFAGCKSITELDLSNFNIRNSCNLSSMFTKFSSNGVVRINQKAKKAIENNGGSDSSYVKHWEIVDEK